MISNLLTTAAFDFEIQNQIGSGGEGEVYLALDIQLNALVAVKRVPLSSFGNVSAFFEESKKLYLSRHHNVVEVNCAGKDNDFIYILMPFYKNGSMKTLMDRNFLTVKQIIRYGIQFLSGLNNIHSKGLVHFDIKPENILISDSDQALVSDFGLAQHTSSLGFSTARGTTPPYAPPELFTQSQHDLKFDIYQAGIALYRMCNGDENFDAQFNSMCVSNGVIDGRRLMTAISKGEFPRRNAYLPHIPVGLKSAINKAINIDLNVRYSSIIDMLNDLSKISFVSDWAYHKDQSVGERWEDGNRIVRAVPKLGGWEIVAQQNGRRVSKYCANLLNDSDKKSLLTTCLAKDWV